MRKTTSKKACTTACRKACKTATKAGLLVQHVRGVAYGYATFNGTEVRYGRLHDEDGNELDEPVKVHSADKATWHEHGRQFPSIWWETNGHRVRASQRPVPVEPEGDEQPAFTVRDVVHGYNQHLKAEHDAAWHTNNGERHRLALEAVTSCSESYGDMPAEDFGPLKLKAVREHLCGQKRSDEKTQKLSVKTINERMRIIRAAFAWAVSEERIAAAVLHGLNAVKALRQGKPGTRGSRKVLPVERADVDAVLPLLSAPVAALIELMWWTGARPGELMHLRPCDIDRTGKVWKCSLLHHKNSARGKDRTLFFGPQAQQVLQPFLFRPPTRLLFRPEEGAADLKSRKRAARATPLFDSHVEHMEKKRADRAAARDAAGLKPVEPREHYDAESLRHAVHRAISSINRKRKADGAEPMPAWHPNRLRHSAATRIKKEHGIEAARVLLGHSSAMTTEIYAEADLQAAAKVMEAAG